MLIPLRWIPLAVMVAFAACRGGSDVHADVSAPSSRVAPTQQPLAPQEHDAPSMAAAAIAPGQAVAVFAGGCFWCMESPFEVLRGVTSVTSGYTGGRTPNPSYRQVSNGATGHYEAIRVVYDPAVVTYAALLDVFFHNIDPTQGDGQFCDEGEQYRSAIFTSDAVEQRQAAEAMERVHVSLGRPIATRTLEATTFYVAEDFHQDFYRNHPDHYRSYRLGCGRDQRLRELWGAPSSH